MASTRRTTTKMGKKKERKDTSSKIFAGCRCKLLPLRLYFCSMKQRRHGRRGVFSRVPKPADDRRHDNIRHDDMVDAATTQMDEQDERMYTRTCVHASKN